MLNVSYHSDYLITWRTIRRLAQVLSNRIFILKLLPGQCFINDRDVGSFTRVLQGKYATFHQFNSHGLKIIWTDCVANGGRFLAILGFRPPLDKEHRVVCDAKWKPIGN